MAENSEFRQQAVTTANLLLEAASLLETSQTTEVGAAQYQRPRPRQSQSGLGNVSGDSSSSAGPSYYASPVGTSGSSQHASVAREVRSLFNWTSRGKATKLGKRKASSSVFRQSKKGKRGNTWTHSWVCLSGTADDAVPDATERATLKMAGLGECRFPVDSSSTAQDLCSALEAQYPKLVEGGGFELLRAEEGCPRELVAIPIPESGYTVDYLKAIVHNAKLYIRPLQSDLSLEPLPADVRPIVCFLKSHVISVLIVMQSVFQTPEELCKKCHRLVAVSDLKKNISVAVPGNVSALHV